MGQYTTTISVMKNGVQAIRKNPMTKAMVVAVRISLLRERLLGLLFILVMAIFQMAAYDTMMTVNGSRKKTTKVKRTRSVVLMLGIVCLMEAAKAEMNQTRNKAM